MKRLAASVLLLVAACHPKANPPDADDTAHRPLPAGSALATVRLTNAAPRIDVVGTVFAERTATLSARLSATIQDVLVSAGDRVKTGQILLTLDDSELREQLAAAKAQYEQAELEFSRTSRLFDHDAATSQALTAAESAFHIAQAAAIRMTVMLSYASVTSPLDGFVTERRVQSGDLANPGQPLLTVYDPAHMRLEVPVPVRLVPHLALGQAVDVTLDQSAQPLRGVVTELVSEIDPVTRTRIAKIRLDDAGDGVLPGAFGRVWIEEDPRPMLLLPAAAVRHVGQLDVVNVVDGTRVQERLVRTGPRRGDDVEILSGLQAGDVVAVGDGSTP